MAEESNSKLQSEHKDIAAQLVLARFDPQWLFVMAGLVPAIHVLLA